MEIPPHNIPSDNAETRQSKISVGMLFAAFDGAWRRFPVSMIFIAYATLWAMLYIVGFEDFWREDAPNLIGALSYLAGTGTLLTLAISLWCEYLGRPSKWPMATGLLLLAADFVYILCCGSELGHYWSLSRLSIITALVVATLFVPSRKMWSWNFTNSQMGGMIISAVFSWGFLIAVGLIFMTVYALFNVEEFKVMMCVNTIFGFTVPAVIFLHLIPRRTDVEAEAERFKASKFQCGTAKYFMLFVTVVYMAILYAYGLKILFTWELPRGVVSWSVTGLTVAVLITLFLLEGVRRTHPDDSLTLRAVRWLPVAMLPLFLLMSIGLFYRIGQYGLTVSRLYVLTFNVWCYAVFLYMIFSRTRIFSGVAISFAFVFMATSVIPYFNYTTLSDGLMRRSLRGALEEIGFTDFPVGEAEFVEAYRTLPKRQRNDLKSKIHYLDAKGDHSKLADITQAVYYSDSTDTYISGYFIHDSLTDDTVVVKSTRKNVEYATGSDFMPLPQGYTSVRQMRHHLNEIKMPTAIGPIYVKGTRYILPIDSIMALDPESAFGGLTLRPASGRTDTIFAVRRIEMGYDSDVWADKRKLKWMNLDGYVFVK